mmetsp:Transcript_14201/g.32200  ORF Transcript_14201/g.32200 Transcript_14201/m.32200 type:complete len:204 (-) Transcript_14201:1379-1990(-)
MCNIHLMGGLAIAITLLFYLRCNRSWISEVKRSKICVDLTTLVFKHAICLFTCSDSSLIHGHICSRSLIDGSCLDHTIGLITCFGCRGLIHGHICSERLIDGNRLHHTIALIACFGSRLSRGLINGLTCSESSIRHSLGLIVCLGCSGLIKRLTCRFSLIDGTCLNLSLFSAKYGRLCLFNKLLAKLLIVAPRIEHGCILHAW